MRLHPIVIALLLAACGGGEPEEPEAESGPVRAAYRTSVQVVLYGDSTEEGNRAGTNNAVIVQERLDRLGQPVRVWQEAKGGTAAKQLLEGTDGVHSRPFPETLSDQPAQIIGLRYGLNDIFEQTPQTFGQVLEELIRIAGQSRKVVILQTPSPTDIAPRHQAEVLENVKVIRRIAAAHPDTVVLCDHHRVGMNRGIETLDGVHPTALDYRKRQSGTLLRCIEEAISRLR